MRLSSIAAIGAVQKSHKRICHIFTANYARSSAVAETARVTIRLVIAEDRLTL